MSERLGLPERLWWTEGDFATAITRNQETKPGWLRLAIRCPARYRLKGVPPASFHCANSRPIKIATLPSAAVKMYGIRRGGELPNSLEGALQVSPAELGQATVIAQVGRTTVRTKDAGADLPQQLYQHLH